MVLSRLLVDFKKHTGPNKYIIIIMRNFFVCSLGLENMFFYSQTWKHHGLSQTIQKVMQQKTRGEGAVQWVVGLVR